MILTEKNALPSIVPDYYKQRQIVLPALRESLTEDAVWYLIPFKWFEQWKSIAEKDENSQKCPPLDISILFEKNKLKMNPQVLITYVCWIHLDLLLIMDVKFFLVTVKYDGKKI